MSEKWQVVPLVLTRVIPLDDHTPVFADRLDRDAFHKRIGNPFSDDNWAEPTVEDWCE